MAEKQRLALRFMAATGRMRAVFGPAQQGSTAGPVAYRNDAAQKRRQEELQQWEVVRNADGSTYLVSRQGG